MIEPDIEAYQREQGESSRKQGNNSELIEMLRNMEKGMLERDSQLKAQLKIRNQNFEAKIRKRDQFMSEVIK